MMLGLGRQRQELLGARIGPHAGSVAEAQQRECTAPMHLWFSGVFLSKAGASQELKGPSDLFVVRSLKCASDVFAYLKIRERREDKREESVHGKH